MTGAARALTTLAFLALLGSAAGGSSGRAPRPAPELTGATKWLNVRGGEALTLAGLRNKVVLIEFWTGG
jgi:hypothetical protein